MHLESLEYATEQYFWMTSLNLISVSYTLSWHQNFSVLVDWDGNA